MNDTSTGCSANWNGWDISTNETMDTSTTIRNYHSTVAHVSQPSSTAGGCNESAAFNNSEKSLYHGLKSVYRFSREHDGEYGTDDDPPFETAARIAANVAIAYLMTTDQTYTREVSFEYIEEEFARSPGLVEGYFSNPPLDTRVGDMEFENAIEHAWYQIDSKQNHYDAARTALAAADLYLSGEINGLVQPVIED